MTIDELLSRLDAVRPRGPGRWQARCPAHHPDRNPSLSVNEGDTGILLKCWAGCELEEITAALGLTMADLFYDSDLLPHERQPARLTPRARPYDWRRFAFQVHLKAVDLQLRGEAVKNAAKDLDTSAWSEVDLDEAWKALDHAQADLDRADQLDRLDFDLCVYGKQQEQERGTQPRRSAA